MHGVLWLLQDCKWIVSLMFKSNKKQQLFAKIGQKLFFSSVIKN